MTSPRVVVVSWAPDHGRSRGLAAVLGAETLFMPWASARRSFARTVLGWARSAVRTWRCVRALPSGSVIVVMCPPVWAVATSVVAAGRSRPVVIDAHSGTFNDPVWAWSHGLLRRLCGRARLLLVTNAEVASAVLPQTVPTLVVHDPLQPAGPTPVAPLPDAVRRPYVLCPAVGAPDEPVRELVAAAALLAGDPLVVLTGRHPGVGGPGLLTTGFVPRPTYEALVAGASAVIALTTREGTMQRAAYEAVEAGVPVVCSDTTVLRTALAGAATCCANEAAAIASAVLSACARDRAEVERACAATRSRFAAGTTALVSAVADLLPAATGPTRPPLVSVVVNNYNYERFVGRAVDSALAQTWSRLEVVVVDDGSSDGSPEVLASYGERIRLVRKSNGGQASAVNAGFAASRGEVVLFLDADDELDPQAVERVVEGLTPGVAKLHFRLRTVDADGRALGGTDPSAASALPTGDLRRAVLKAGRCTAPVMSGNAYPRWVLERILPMPEPEFRLCADGYLVSLAALHGPVAALEEPHGSYRIHGGNGWAQAGADPARLRARVEHDLVRHRAVAHEAARLRLRPSPVMGRGDQLHLRARLASLRVDPDHHPLSGDRTGRLVRSGLASALRSPGASLRRRAVGVMWFPVVAWAPRRLALVAVDAVYSPHVAGRRRYHQPTPSTLAPHPIDAAGPGGLAPSRRVVPDATRRRTGKVSS